MRNHNVSFFDKNARLCFLSACFALAPFLKRKGKGKRVWLPPDLVKNLVLLIKIYTGNEGEEKKSITCTVSSPLVFSLSLSLRRIEVFGFHSQFSVGNVSQLSPRWGAATPKVPQIRVPSLPGPARAGRGFGSSGWGLGWDLCLM